MSRCVIYRHESAPCGYILARAFRRHRGPGRYRWATDEADTLLIQTDWDWPGFASCLGWQPRHAATRAQNRRCDHSGTDGTIDCDGCGLDASSMISSAAAWLDEHEGQTFHDPGYF